MEHPKQVVHMPFSSILFCNQMGYNHPCLICTPAWCARWRRKINVLYCFLTLCFAILVRFTFLPTKETGPSILWEMSYGLSSLSQLALPLSMFGNVVRVHVFVGLPGMEAPLLSIMTAILCVHMEKFLYCWL